MNARTVAQIVAVAGALGTLVAGCAVKTDGEAVGESTEALGSGLGQGGKMTSCPDAGPLNASVAAEALLISVGCYGDRFVTGNNGSGYAFDQVLCPSDGAYKQTVYEPIGPKGTLVPVTWGYTIQDVISANSGGQTAMTSGPASFCPGGTYTAPGGTIIVDFDPLCGTGPCNITTPPIHILH